MCVSIRCMHVRVQNESVRAPYAANKANAAFSVSSVSLAGLIEQLVANTMLSE